MSTTSTTSQRKRKTKLKSTPTAAREAQNFVVQNLEAIAETTMSSPDPTPSKDKLCTSMVNAAADCLKESLLALQSDLQQLTQLTRECLDALNAMETSNPMRATTNSDSDSDDSLSDTVYPESKMTRRDHNVKALLLEKSLDNNAPAIGEWERHTRGIGSKLMLAMGYVPGMRLGAAAAAAAAAAAGEGRVHPVEARPAPRGRSLSLDRCMAMSESLATQDPLKLAPVSRHRRTTPQLETIPGVQEPRVPEPVPELQPIDNRPSQVWRLCHGQSHLQTTILDQSAVVLDLNVDVEKDIALPTQKLATQPQKRTSQEIPSICQTKRARYATSRQNLSQNLVQQEPKIADSRVPPPEPMQPTQEEEEKRRSRTRRSESSETMLGSLYRTKVSLGDSDQTTDSMTFIRYQWGTEGTMKKILKMVIKKIEPIYFNTLLSRGPLLPGHKRMIAAQCFRSIMKLKQQGFIKVYEDPDPKKKLKIYLGEKFEDK